MTLVPGANQVARKLLDVMSENDKSLGGRRPKGKRIIVIGVFLSHERFVGLPEVCLKLCNLKYQPDS